MTNIHTILNPTDFSAPSDEAHRIASAVAGDYGAKLLILHAWQPPAVVRCRVGAVPVTDPEAGRNEARLRLEEWQATGPGPTGERVLSEGDAGDAILRVASDRHCDLIVMGTHGRSGLDRLVLGSVAEYVTRRAPCPVLTVRPPPADRTTE